MPWARSACTVVADAHIGMDMTNGAECLTLGRLQCGSKFWALLL